VSKGGRGRVSPSRSHQAPSEAQRREATVKASIWVSTSSSSSDEEGSQPHEKARRYRCFCVPQNPVPVGACGFESHLRHHVISTTCIDQRFGGHNAGVHLGVHARPGRSRPIVLEMAKSIVVALDEPIGGLFILRWQILTTVTVRPKVRLLGVSQIRIDGEIAHERREVALDNAPQDLQVHGIVPVD